MRGISHPGRPGRASKTAEAIAPTALDWPFHGERRDELERDLDVAFTDSKLPEDRDKREVSEFLASVRLGQQ